MAHVFRDSCRDALRQRGLFALIPFWLQTLSDLFGTACLEHWSVFQERTRSMTTFNDRRTVSLRLWIALTATILAFALSLVASLNLYLIEDPSRSPGWRMKHRRCFVSVTMGYIFPRSQRQSLYAPSSAMPWCSVLP